MTTHGAFPIAEFAFPGPLRDRLIAAILDGTKTSTSSTLLEYSTEKNRCRSSGPGRRSWIPTI